MAKSASATVNPFASAAKKSSTSASKPARSIFVASNLLGPDGKVKYTGESVAGGIENYIQGHTLFEEGSAMKESSRPVILDFARQRQAQEWLIQGRRPENPALATDESGGTQVKVVFMDSSNKLDDFQFGQLAALIGQSAAEANVTRRHEFTINPELLDQEVDVQKGGKTVRQNVMEALTEALQEKFAPSPEILAGLFKAVEVFQTNKGLIDKGMQLVAPTKSAADAFRLAEFLKVARFTTQIKTGAKSGE